MGSLRAYLHEGGRPQVGEVTFVKLPHLTCKRDHIKMRGYLDRRVTPPKRVPSPTWGPPPPCKRALRCSGDEKVKKNNGLIRQNNNFVRASRVFVRFFAVTARLPHENT